MEYRRFEDRKEPEIVYSRSIKAGKRIYYLDVRKARNEDLYLCITESKKRAAGEAEVPQFEKHKLFLYKEDFAHFTEGLQDVINYVQDKLGTIEERQEWVPGEHSDSAPVSEAADAAHTADADAANVSDAAHAAENANAAGNAEDPEAEPKKKGLFGFLKKD